MGRTKNLDSCCTLANKILELRCQDKGVSIESDWDYNSWYVYHTLRTNVEQETKFITQQDSWREWVQTKNSNRSKLDEQSEA